MNTSPRFCDFEEVMDALMGRSVAVVGSGPGALDNPPGFIDSHDVVVRVNNHKCSDAAGWRTDVHFSFYGTSIRSNRDDLVAQGVRFCVCKCPDAKVMESEWHRVRNKPHGVDFRYIYQHRAGWWFCPTYVPTVAEFLEDFELLGRHVPTTGFSAIRFALDCGPKSVYLTGFDGFKSGLHNVNEVWKPGDPSDPIGHAPDREFAWLRDRIAKDSSIKIDAAMMRALKD